jgi:hypothetical protein
MELPVTRSARAIALTATMIALFALAGCSSGPKPTLYCPNVAILQEANHVIRGRGKQNDLATRVVDARITGVAGKCTKSGKVDVRVAFQIGFFARRGPALTQNSITLPYFIATVQGNQIFDKQVYPVTFDFKGGVPADEVLFIMFVVGLVIGVKVHAVGVDGLGAGEIGWAVNDLATPIAIWFNSNQFVGLPNRLKEELAV